MDNTAQLRPGKMYASDAPVYVIDASSKYAVSAARKIAQEYRPGAVIELSAEEFMAWQTHSRRVDL